jgi:hypothetical protein
MEDSIESFIAQFKPYAATVQLLSKVEGSPLLECVAGQKVLHLLERTGPYTSRPGKAQVILNPMAESLQKTDLAEKSFTITAVSRLKAHGLVLERSENVVIIDAGIPLVVSLFNDTHQVNLGDYVKFESLPPIHGFVVPKEEQRVYRRGETDNEI